MMSHKKTVKYCWEQFQNRMVLTRCIGSLPLEGAAMTQWKGVTFSWTLLILDVKAKALESSHEFNRQFVRNVYNSILNRIYYYTDWRILLDELDTLKSQYFKGEAPEDALITGSARDVNSILTYQRNAYYANSDLVLDEIEAWCDNEDRLASLELPDDILGELESVMRRWLKDLNFNKAVFHHSSGACCQLSRRDGNKLNKTLLIEKDATLNVALNSLNYHFSFPYLDINLKKGIARTSRLIYVPKNYKAMRGVNPEPAGIMFFQQGVKDELYRYIAHHSLLKKVLPLHNQERNRELALFGSFVDSFATVDLSAASDSISWTLVKRVFRHTPLYKWILATRSTHTSVQVGGMSYSCPIHKYAPMGSALTFPIESLLFAGITYITYRKLCELTKQDFSDVMFSETVAVYGDDIVCPNWIYDGLTAVLRKLGFIPNEEKSFHTGRFRESCGIEAYKGRDVTPLRFGKSFRFTQILKPHSLLPEQLSQYYSKINSCYFRGYLVLRTFWLEQLKSATNRGKPIYARLTNDANSDEGIFTPSSISYDDRRVRYNCRYQRHEVLCTMVVSKDTNTVNYDGALGAFNSLTDLERRPIEAKDRYAAPILPNPVLRNLWLPLDMG